MVDPANSVAVIEQAPKVPVIEIIKVYGRLAGTECYGMKSPTGSSCQITSTDIDRIFKSSPDTTISETEFSETISKVNFQWPLKPYGIDNSKSLSKTAVMNKGAETKVYMDLLEERGLYDKRNPTGPLPSSLRPQLNKQLQSETIDQTTIHIVYEKLVGAKKDGQLLRVSQIRKTLLETETGVPMDYYGFLDLIGKETITWPY